MPLNLVSCKYCNDSISPEAEYCPKCGGPNKSKKKSNIEIILAIVVFIQTIVVAFIGYSTQQLENTTQITIAKMKEVSEKQIKNFENNCKERISEANRKLDKEKAYLLNKQEHLKLIQKALNEIFNNKNEKKITAIMTVYGIYGNDSIPIFKRMLLASAKLKNNIQDKKTKVIINDQIKVLQAMLDVTRSIKDMYGEWGVKISFHRDLESALTDTENIRNKCKANVRLFAKINEHSQDEYYVIVTGCASENEAREQSNQINKDLGISSIPINFSDWKVFNEKVEELFSYQISEKALSKINLGKSDAFVLPFCQSLNIQDPNRFDKWNATFIYWCINNSGFILPIKPEKSQNTFALVETWIEWAKRNNYWHIADEPDYVPQKNDLIILGIKNNYYYIGVVTDYNIKSKEVTFIAADYENSEKVLKYTLRDILKSGYRSQGYIRITKNKNNSPK